MSFFLNLTNVKPGRPGLNLEFTASLKFCPRTESRKGESRLGSDLGPVSSLHMRSCPMVWHVVQSCPVAPHVVLSCTVKDFINKGMDTQILMSMLSTQPPWPGKSPSPLGQDSGLRVFTQLYWPILKRYLAGPRTLDWQTSLRSNHRNNFARKLSESWLEICLRENPWETINENKRFFFPRQNFWYQILGGGFPHQQPLQHQLVVQQFNSILTWSRVSVRLHSPQKSAPTSDASVIGVSRLLTYLPRQPTNSQVPRTLLRFEKSLEWFEALKKALYLLADFYYKGWNSGSVKWKRFIGEGLKSWAETFHFLQHLPVLTNLDVLWTLGQVFFMKVSLVNMTDWNTDHW